MDKTKKTKKQSLNVVLRYTEHTLFGDNEFYIYMPQKDWDSIKKTNKVSYKVESDSEYIMV